MDPRSTFRPRLPTPPSNPHRTPNHNSALPLHSLPHPNDGHSKLAHHKYRPPRPRLPLQLLPLISPPHPRPRLPLRSPIPFLSNKTTTPWGRHRRCVTRSAGKCALRWRCCGESTQSFMLRQLFRCLRHQDNAKEGSRTSTSRPFLKYYNQ